MLRGSYLAAGDRFTVRVGGVVMGIGKVAVQDAWSRGGPRQEARNAGHKRPNVPTEAHTTPREKRSLTMTKGRKSREARRTVTPMEIRAKGRRELVLLQLLGLVSSTVVSYLLVFDSEGSPGVAVLAFTFTFLAGLVVVLGGAWPPGSRRRTRVGTVAFIYLGAYAALWFSFAELRGSLAFVGPTLMAVVPFIALLFQDDREMEAQKQEASDEAWRRRRIMVARRRKRALSVARKQHARIEAERGSKAARPWWRRLRRR